jgi:putative ABC transport system permease protein
VAIYNTMDERRREIAILRAIGARRFEVVATIVGEAAALTSAGALLGCAGGHLLILALAGRIQEISGLRPDPTRLLPEELGLFAVVSVVGALAGLIPAWKAYRTDVARNLAPRQ